MKTKVLITVFISALLTGVAYLNFHRNTDSAKSGYIIERSIKGAKEIAQKTNNLTAQNIIRFIESGKVKICNANIDSLGALKDKRDTLYVVPFVSDGILVSKNHAGFIEMFHTSLNGFVYENSILLLDGRRKNKPTQFSDNYLGVILLYTIYLHGTSAGDSPFAAQLEEIAAIEFAGKLFYEMGSPVYRNIFDTEVKRIKAQYADSPQVTIPKHESIKAAIESFGKPGMQKEADFITNIFLMSCVFEACNQQADINPSMLKITFLSDMQMGII